VKKISGVAAVLAAVGLVIAVPSPAQAATTVKISQIYYNSPGADTRSNASLNAEYVRVLNPTTRTQVITGWTVRDAAGHTYRFGTTSIPAGKSVVLHTGRGTNTATARYWQSRAYIWNNDRDTAYLRNSAGRLVFSCSYNNSKVAYRNC
jgi:hypothetical protein